MHLGRRRPPHDLDVDHPRAKPSTPSRRIEAPTVASPSVSRGAATCSRRKEFVLDVALRRAVRAHGDHPAALARCPCTPTAEVGRSERPDPAAPPRADAANEQVDQAVAGGSVALEGDREARASRVRCRPSPPRPRAPGGRAPRRARTCASGWRRSRAADGAAAAVLSPLGDGAVRPGLQGRDVAAAASCGPATLTDAGSGSPAPSTPDPRSPPYHTSSPSPSAAR